MTEYAYADSDQAAPIIAARERFEDHFQMRHLDQDATIPRVLLLGELNPYGTRPDFALWDEPECASGNRLRRILGLRSEVYRCLWRANLCTGKWAIREARERAEQLLDAPRPWNVVVALGRKVARGFGVEWSWQSQTASRFTLVSIPHPSGLCRAWNEPGAVARARALLQPFFAPLELGSAADAFPALRLVMPVGWSDGLP